MIAAAVALSALALIPAPRSFCWTGLSGGQEPVRCPRVWVLAACTEEPKNAEVKAELPARRVLGGVILGEDYHTDIDDVVSCVKRAGERREALVLTSHGIHPNAKGIHMKTEWLERILSAAQKYGVAVLSFDEVPLRIENKE